ncbi:MAG: outer membrane beta-barrel protein [Acidobacteriota bacterium]
MKKIVMLICFLGLLAMGTLAQQYQEGIPWGNAYFKPSVEFIYAHSDNIMRVDSSMGDKLDDNFWIIRPQVGLEFPFENSYVNLAIQYEYKDYDDYDLVHHDTWAGTLDSQFRFANNSVLSIQDHYIQGVQQTEQFDPDMEVYWGTSKFSRNQLVVDYSIRVTSLNTLGLHLSHNFVDFKSDYDSGILPFYSYGQKGGGVTWKYHYQPLASLVFEWELIQSDPRNDNYLYTPVGTFTTEKSYRENRISIGWEGNAQRKLSGFAKIGYKRMNFGDYLGISFDDYKGVVADAGLTLRLTEFSDLNAVLFRHGNQSSFNVNNYYTATGADIRFHHQFNRYLFGTIGGKYQKNDYPEGIDYDVNKDGMVDVSMFWYLRGQKRNDEITQFLAELGYHFTPRVSLRLNYFYENRDSNLRYIDAFNILRKPFTYSENRFVFQIQMGW